MESTVWKIWEKNLPKQTKQLAVVDLSEDRSWTFQQIQDEVTQSIQAFKITRGSRVAFAGLNHSRWLIQFLTIQAQGGIAFAMDPQLSPSMQKKCARDHQAHFWWNEGMLEPIKSKKRLTSTPIAFEKLTSGSTGAPQAIPWTHRNLLVDGTQIMTSMGIRPRDIQLGLIPLGHSYAIGSLVIPWILQGTPLLLAPSFVPSQIPLWIKKWKATVFPTVPSIIQILSSTPSIQSLQPLRLVVSAGARLSPEVAQGFLQKFKIRAHNFYGSTETGGIAYDKTGTAALLGRGIGKPLKGVKISFDRQGCILVKSPAVAFKNNQYKLPDTGYWNSKKELVLTGRLKAPVNVGGKKVYPQEIERLLLQISGIKECWVGAIHEKGRDYLMSVVEGKIEESVVYRALLKELPDWKMPRKIRVVSHLPRTPRGKIDLEKTKSLFI